MKCYLKLSAGSIKIFIQKQVFTSAAVMFLEETDQFRPVATDYSHVSSKVLCFEVMR